MKLKSEKPVARCFEDGDGFETQVAFIDGYGFGDRLLEGVMFRLELLPDKYLEVSTAPKSASYMKDLNEARWLKAALASAIDDDDGMFSEKERGGRDLGYADYVEQ